MGADPSAILYYGIHVGGINKEDFISADYDYHGMNEAWEKDHAPKRPTSEDYHSAEWDEWRAKKAEYEKSPEHVEMDWSGSEHGDTHYVHCPCFERKVEWDEQEDLGHPTLDVQGDADKWIREFCERFKLPYRQPTWHLAARYF